MSRILAVAAVLAFSVAPAFADDAPAAAPAAAASAAAAPGATLAVPAAAKVRKGPASTGALKSEDERTFYAYGFKIGQNLSQFGMSDAESAAISQGLRDAIAGKEPKINMAVYLPKVSDMAKKRMDAKSAGVKAKGQTYSDAFQKEDGVKEIPHGGWIKTLTEGTGDLPSADDTVKVNYRGTLTDGTEFDSSYKRNQPATFPLKNVIPCWTNGVAMMKVGGKAKLVCPSEVAYGDQGHPPVIPGGATLTFEVELLEIVKSDAPKDAEPASDTHPSSSEK
jgi:FKBP-type peptidyl-prolyl cis-trans isomerase FkpA